MNHNITIQDTIHQKKILSKKNCSYWLSVFKKNRITLTIRIVSEIESKALPAFTQIYNGYCDRVVAGEEFIVEPPQALPESPQVLASKKHNRQQLDQLKQLLN